MTLTTHVEESDDGVTVSFAGELDISRADEVERELERIDAKKPATLVLDLRGLDFLDSTGLRLILGADSRARRDGRRVVVVPGPEKVQRVFRITLLDRRLHFAPDPGDPGGGDDGGD